jgi:hypothetical protein
VFETREHDLSFRRLSRLPAQEQELEETVNNRFKNAKRSAREPDRGLVARRQREVSSREERIAGRNTNATETIEPRGFREQPQRESDPTLALGVHVERCGRPGERTIRCSAPGKRERGFLERACPPHHRLTEPVDERSGVARDLPRRSRDGLDERLYANVDTLAADMSRRSELVHRDEHLLGTSFECNDDWRLRLLDLHA